MKKLNPEHSSAIIALINQSPFLSLISLEVCKLDYGYCMLEIEIENRHLNLIGGLHGGVYSSAIDTAAYWAVYCAAPEDTGLISLDLRVDNLSAVQSGKLIVEGKQIKAGRTVCLSEGVVKDQNGRALAYGSSKQMIVPGVPSVTQAIKAMGYEALPPKYLTEPQST